MSRGYKDQGIILARKNFGEADRWLTIFSQNHGKIRILAKGVRKPSSRKRGHLEIFSWVRFAATKTKTIDLMTEVETINSFAKIRQDLKRAAVAYFLLETADKLTKEEEKNYQYFKLLLNYLQKLKKSNKLKKLRQAFVTDSLVLLGFWPAGKPLGDVDEMLEYFTERKINSLRVGKKILL